MENTVNNFLNKYLPVIQKNLLLIKEKRFLGKTAKILGFNQSRLSQFISGQRKLTKYYVIRFIRREVIPVNKFLEGKKLENLTSEEREFWEEMEFIEDKDLMKAMIEAKKANVDLLSLIKAATPNKD